MPAPAYKMGSWSPPARPTAPPAKLGALDARRARLGRRQFDVQRSLRLFPERFYRAFIAEQGMMGAAMGLASRGIAFPSTFACFSAAPTTSPAWLTSAR
jgi:hypothetical protein